MKYGVKSKTYSRYLQEFGSYGEARVFTLKQRQVWNNATMQIYEIDGLQEDLLVEQFSPTKGTNYNKITTMKKLKEEQKDEAYEAYKAIQSPARKIADEIINLVEEVYDVIEVPAWSSYKAKLREIDEQEEK